MIEDDGDLCGAALRGGDRERVLDTRRKRVGVGNFTLRRAQPEAAEVVVHVVVAVPAAVVLLQVEVQDAALGKVDRLLENEDGLPGRIAAAGAGVDAPRRVVLAVDRKAHRPRDALLLALVVVVLLEVAFGVRVVRERFGELQLGSNSRSGRTGLARFLDLDAELGERACSHERAAGAVARQVRIVEQFEPERGDALNRARPAHQRAELRRGVALREGRAVLLWEVALRVVPRVLDRHGLPLRQLLDGALLPLRHAFRPVRMRVLQLLDLGLHLVAQAARLHLVGRRVRHPLRLVVVVEKREDAEVFFLRDGVELVIVALGARNAQAEERLADGVDPVEHRVHAELFRIDAALFVQHRHAEEARGHDLILRRVRQQVAGELLPHEAIVRHVVVEGLHHPIAVHPDLPRFVLLVAVRVGVAGGVEPDAGPALAVVRRGEQLLHELLVSVRALVREVVVDFLRARRQADEIEVKPPTERDLVRLGSRSELLFLKPIADERIDRISRVRPGNEGAHGCLERPVFRGIDRRCGRLRAVGAGQRYRDQENAEREKAEHEIHLAARIHFARSIQPPPRTRVPA